ncbi:uncharacterized protein LOC126802314 isoform X2 [Argentina anserina]|uniref:uncharacterized protein LOC126802314 isoform X2 n=1 Tax=Argentina anserina TaxID=57926 RepID=UPI0021767B4D|nr:uncharacterized protein LOC126802314 isoform X2 [Potentilla anserina]
MESSAVLRSFNCSVGTVSQIRSFADKPGMLPVYNARRPTSSRSSFQGLMVSEKFIYSPQKRKGVLISCVKTTEAAKTENSSVLSDSKQESTSEGSPQSTVFPNGYEALMLEVCDETEIAELKLKVGDFQMHIKRNIGATSAPVSTISPTVAPPIPSPPASPPKSSPAKATPFNNGSVAKSPKLAALEASGSNGYILVTSPTVGSFRRGRTVKGKKQPPIFNEGDLIKEGQVIGYVDQFGTELPVKTDVGGEVLKLLFNDGDAVGYGDALIAVLPSFHGIR